MLPGMPTPLPMDDRYQAHQRGNCEDCGWHSVARWSQVACLVDMLEHAARIGCDYDHMSVVDDRALEPGQRRHLRRV